METNRSVRLQAQFTVLMVRRQIPRYILGSRRRISHIDSVKQEVLTIHCPNLIMSRTGPIIIIDDDQDDQEMIDRILGRLPLKNEIKKFFDDEKALSYFLKTTDSPLLVLCDINMPLMNGIELKQTIQKNENLCKKTTPFVFLGSVN